MIIIEVPHKLPSRSCTFAVRALRERLSEDSIVTFVILIPRTPTVATWTLVLDHGVMIVRLIEREILRK